MDMFSRISNSRSEHTSSSGLINHGIELQVPPTPQLVKRGVDLTYTGPMEAGMIAGFLWFQGTFLQCGTIQVLGKKNIQPDFLEVRLAEVKKKKKSGRNSNFDKSCL